MTIKRLIGTDADQIPRNSDLGSLAFQDASGVNVGTIQVNSAALVPLGTAASPSIKFIGDTNTGIYSPAADQVAIAANGATKLTISSSTITLGAPIAAANFDITGVNSLAFADPGPNEGVSWAGGELWSIWESPNDLTTNTLGNLQIVRNGARISTFSSVGLEVPGLINIGVTTAKVPPTTALTPHFAVEKSAAYATLSAYAYSTATSAGGVLVLGRSKSATLGTLTSTASGDTLGIVSFEGVNTNATPALSFGAYIAGIQDGAGGTTYIPGKVSIFTGTNAAIAAERVRVDSSGKAIFAVSNITSTVAPSLTNPSAIYVNNSTYTDGATAASGTVASVAAVSIDNPTYAASNTGVTITNAATLYVDAAPVAGTNVTIGSAFALWVASGWTYTAGGLLSNVLDGSSSGATQTLGSNITSGSLTVLGSQAAATFTLGGTAGTGTITLGRSTAAQTVEIATGATANATTKTVNIGANGVSGSTTNVNIGSAVVGALGTTTIHSPTTIIKGNLQVDGTTTTVNSTTISVDDKNIELGAVTTPTDTTADGGGLTVLGATNKTWNWVNATDSWTSNKNIDIASTMSYKIAGNIVLTATSLADAVIIDGGTY